MSKTSFMLILINKTRFLKKQFIIKLFENFTGSEKNITSL